MNTIEINNEVYQFPSCWEEVMMKNYLDALKEDNAFDVYMKMFGLPEFLEEYDLLLCEEFVDAVSFLLEEPKPQKKWGEYFVPENLKHLTLYELHILDDQAKHHSYPFAVIASVVLRREDEIPKPGDGAFARRLQTHEIWRRCEDFIDTLPVTVALACADAFVAYRKEIQETFKDLFVENSAGINQFGWMELAYYFSRVSNVSIYEYANANAWDTIYSYCVELSHVNDKKE